MHKTKINYQSYTNTYLTYYDFLAAMWEYMYFPGCRQMFSRGFQSAIKKIDLILSFVKMRGQKDLRTINKISTQGRNQRENGHKMLQNCQMTDFGETLNQF